MTSTSNGLLVLCLDGADDNVIDELTEAGRLPVLQRLMKDGGVAIFSDVSPGIEEAIWPVMMSGTSYGDVGMYHFCSFDPDQMTLRFKREWVGETWWHHLPDRGRDALIVDVPEMHPNPDSRADEICGWHGVDPEHPISSSNPALLRTIRRLKPPMDLVEPLRFTTIAEDESMSRRMIESAQRRASNLAAISAGRRVIVAGVHETHPITHGLGHHWARDHWAAPANPNRELIAVVYEQIDTLIGSLVDRLPGYRVAVLTGRGILPSAQPGDIMSELLERMGLLVRPGGDATSGGRSASSRLRSMVRAAIPQTLRESLATRLLSNETQWRLAKARFFDEHDWSRTKAFTSPAWLDAFIRVNLAGRERDGIVPAAEYEPLLTKIEAAASELRDADSGKPLVRKISRMQRAFPGSMAELFPDLLIEATPGGPSRLVTHPTFGEWAPRFASDAPMRVTRHRLSGRMILSGPGVGAGVAEEIPMAAVAQTLLAAGGVRRAGYGGWDIVRNV